MTYMRKPGSVAMFAYFDFADVDRPLQCQDVETCVVTSWSCKALTCQHNTTAMSCTHPKSRQLS